MALKEKALKRLAEKLASAGVPFTLGGEWLLARRGILPDFHAFDVLVSPEDAPAADRVLTRLGMRSEPREAMGCFRADYHFDGADIRLWGGMAFEGGLRAVGPERPAGEETVLGVPVPVGYPEDWYVWYSLLGSAAPARAIGAWFARHPPEHPERFAACVDGPLPEGLLQGIGQESERN